MRNYKAEIECDHNIDILILRVLRQILRDSKDFLRDKMERKREQTKILMDKVNQELPYLRGELELVTVDCDNIRDILVTSGREQTPEVEESPTASQDVTEDEDNVKRWRVLKGGPLIGSPGKRVTTGETVVEVNPPDDGFVLVRTGDSKEGSLPVSSLGEVNIIIIYVISLIYIFL